MLFLLDTNVFSDLMRKHGGVAARLASLAEGDKVAICSVVRGEVRYGIERVPPGRRREDLRQQAAALWATIPCEPVPEAAGDHYAEVKVARERAGLRLDENDLWIAATALSLGAVLVTRDNDFDQLPGLRIEDWAA